VAQLRITIRGAGVALEAATRARTMIVSDCGRLALVFSVSLSAACSRAEHHDAPSTPATSASSSATLVPCTSADTAQRQPCRSGRRQLDRLPTEQPLGLDLSHCPLDDCGSGGCSYDVYGAPGGGCYRLLGTIHGGWIDVVAGQDGGTAQLRTWGRSGSTLVATDYAMATGVLVQQRQFTCDYGAGRPLSHECPKL
jgi:hypothetical protein